MTGFARVTIVVYVVVLSIGLVSEDVRYVFAGAAFLIFGFLAVGFLLFPKLKAVAPFSLGPMGSHSDRKTLMAGTEVPPSDFPQYFTCVFQIRSWVLLVALAALSISAFCVFVSNVSFDDLIEGRKMSSIYLLSLCISAAFWISAKWYSEQALLARSTVTVGAITGVNEVSSHREVRYEFRDAAGGYFGGMERDFLSGQMDNVVFVIYDESNPDKNSSSRGFMFRSFKVYPSRLAPQEQGEHEQSGNL